MREAGRDGLHGLTDAVLEIHTPADTSTRVPAARGPGAPDRREEKRVFVAQGPSGAALGWGRVASMIVVVVVLTLVPLACWALLARKNRVGWGIGALLLLGAGVEIALMMRWAAVELRLTLLAAVPLVTVATLWVGTGVEGRRLRGGRGRRNIVLALSGLYGFSEGRGFTQARWTRPHRRIRPVEPAWPGST